MEAIVAVFSDWGIGCEGTQQVVLKADRRHFRELTDGAAGRTWSSRGRILQSRGPRWSTAPKRPLPLPHAMTAVL